MKQHPITYEHIGIVFLVGIAITILVSAVLFWTTLRTIPKEIQKDTRTTWHCFSTDGRINYVIVQSEEKPSFLPVGGNEGDGYYCSPAEVIDFDKYKKN